MKSYPFLRVFIIVSCLLCGCLLSAHAGSDDFATLMDNIREDASTNPSTSKIDGYLQVFDASTGAFSDVNYADKGLTTWQPITHLERLADMVFAYTNAKNKYYGSASLYDAIVQGLQYWHERNPDSDNWWFNQISEPQTMGRLLIYMRAGQKTLPTSLEKQLLQRMQSDGGDPAKYTGANRTDIALHWLYRACLQANKSDLQKAVDYIYETVAYTTEEGIQYDNSFCQHGKQLYIGSYGDALLRSVTQVAMYTRGTAYALSGDKLAILRAFLLEAYFPTIRGQYMMYDVMGREISRSSGTKKASSAVYATRMAVVDPSHAEEYNTIAQRLEGKSAADSGVTPQHTHFYCSDYTLHVRPTYTFDVRLSSTRTYRCEYGNNENIKTYFLSDGCNNIAVSGKEYVNIFPLWNWARIPGITAPQLTKIPLPSREWGAPGVATFAGGVSDGTYGATAYSYKDNTLGIATGAQKGWFFFDDEVVCLGAGISSSVIQKVNTTINQCLSTEANDVVVSTNGRTSTVTGSSTQHSPDWVLHDGVAYIFPHGGEVFVEKEAKSANWQDINPPASSKEVSDIVFTIGINHGKRPKNDIYAYIVLCGQRSQSAVQDYCNKGDIEIIANDTKQQAVRHKALGVWEVIFYSAGTFSHEALTITVDHPCVVMVREKDAHSLALSVADPAQAQKNITVSIAYPPAFDGERVTTCQFAGTGVRAGATLSYNIE